MLFFPQTVFSDHAEIVISIKNRHLEKIDANENKGKWHPLGKIYKWDVESLSSMRENLENTPDAQLESVMNMIQSQNSSEAARTLINIIDNAAPPVKAQKNIEKSVNKNTKFRHKMRKKKQKAWFDKDLQDLKKNTNKLSNLKHNQPGNLEIKSMHKESLKSYRDMCKTKNPPFAKNLIVWTRPYLIAKNCGNNSKVLLKSEYLKVPLPGKSPRMIGKIPF